MGNGDKQAEQNPAEEPTVEVKAVREASIQEPEAETRQIPRSSVLLWLLILVALLVALYAVMGRPFITYAKLKASEPGGKRDTLIRTLERQGPFGNELARRYVAAAFRKDRVSGAYMLVRHQSLFLALPFASVKEYLGEPDTKPGAPLPVETQQAVGETKRMGAFATYLVGRDRMLSLRVTDGVVRGVYLDKIIQYGGAPKPLPSQADDKPAPPGGEE